MVEHRADVLGAHGAVLELARHARRSALVGNVVGDRHEALLGELAGVETGGLLLHAAAGIGLRPLDLVGGHVASGKLLRVLDASTPDLLGCHLYYFSRRHASAGFRLFVDTLRYRAKD